MAVETSRVETLLGQFDAACRDLKAVIEAVPDASWRVPTTGDGRQVNVVAHHAASSHRYIANMVRDLADGKPPSLGMDQIHAGNAAHAQKYADCSKAEVLAEHERSASHARDVLRGLDDGMLARRGEVLSGVPSTVEQAIQRILIGHPREHTATIRSTLPEA